MAWISDRPPLEPMWRALVAATASLAGTWPVAHFWMAGQGIGYALLFLGPIYFVVVFGVVTVILSIVLRRIETPVVRVAIIAGCLLIMGISRRELPLWEFLLAAILALTQYLELLRFARDERDLRNLL